MKRLIRPLISAAVLAAFLVGPGNALAQQDQQQQRQRGQGRGGGNFDPAEARARMAEMLRERFEVKSDDEWKVIQERIEKVTTAQNEVRALTSRGGAFGGFGRGGGGRGGDAAQGDNGGRRNRGGGGGGGFFNTEPSPEAEALQKAIDSKASNDELKAKMAKVREARKDKEAKLEKAQKDLRDILTPRQEATAVLMGMLR